MEHVRGPKSEVRSPDSPLRTLLMLMVAGCLLAIFPLQQGIDKQLRSIQIQREELIFLPSETMLSRLSGGYAGLLADFYWNRVVQYFGRHRLAHAKEYALLGT